MPSHALRSSTITFQCSGVPSASQASHVQAPFDTSELTTSTPRDPGCVIVLSHASIAASKPSLAPGLTMPISTWGGARCQDLHQF